MMIEHMNMETINQIKSASKTSNFANSPWKKWFDRMAIKSVLHRLCRRLPNASELVAMCEQGMNMNFDKSKEVKDITEYYSQDIFEDNLEQYTKLIQAGKKTGGQIIKFLQSKHQLSQQQIETLKGIDNV